MLLHDAAGKFYSEERLGVCVLPRDTGMVLLECGEGFGADVLEEE